ncbi:uncharacterized protein LOC127372339 [Dicentrarchus labrax]|uniref:uncharacterized protein LOC127372339 n=1 Tax=Dicentrarchus labrax TaxID=13489 RepID=UPI0021F5FD7A|nr:uncharacterized protein LOC127372339 [Dicentrarchus labrax]
MKTLCVAVVVLSFSSVCQPASLACERLLKPEARNPDLTGRWRYVALSSDLCPTRTIMESVFRPAMEMNITSEVTPNVYSLGFKFKILGMCIHKSHFSTFVYENNTVSAADSNNASPSEPIVLLQSGCPDCIILRNDAIHSLILLSRRETVTAAEMKEFETQAKCSGLPEPQLFMSDHVYENCTMLEDFLHTFSSQVDIEKARSLNEKIMNCRQQR